MGTGGWLLRLALAAVISLSAAGLENDDLVFDHDNKISIIDVPAEHRNEYHQSLIHNIWKWLNFEEETFSSPFISAQAKKASETNFITNNRIKRDIKEDENEVTDDDSVYKLKSYDLKDNSTVQSIISQKYQQGDDEDDIGSGDPEVERETEREVEGSANNIDFLRPTTVSNISPVTETNSVDQQRQFNEKNIYRISMIIKEPYQEEYNRRDGEKFQKFADNFTKTIEEILHRNLREDQHVVFVKMENAPDSFESLVHLDIHTMNSESEVRDTLEKHLNTYYSLGKFAVNPLTFRLRAVLECPPGEITCDVSRCILQTQRCDFKADCEDGSDEADCKYPVCAPDEFRCNNGQCIKSTAYCNNRPDCYDNSDEANCLTTCAAHEYRCLEGVCISIDKRCNGYPDCRNGDDEDSCDLESITRANYPVCRSDEFECYPGYCISLSNVCNGHAECPDGIDERDCYGYNRNREEDRLNIKVYPTDQIIKEHGEVVFQCRDEGPLRAKVRWSRGNGRPLPPGSRMDNGRLEMPNIQLNESGSYVCEAESYLHLPGAQVIAQLTVEKSNHTWTASSTTCGQHEATCNNEQCIPKSFICDGKHDCADGSDEMRCGLHGCEPNEFHCANKQCVSKIWRCDGDKDCSDGSDEHDCSATSNYPCNYGEFKCATNNQCIPKSYHCDHESDCIDGSDEIGCAPVYIVKPPPPMIVLDPGDTLSLTCSAIGVPTPEINWRLNWGHIPQKCATTSINGTGTLDCPDVRVEDQGAYSCEGINVMGFVIAVPDTILVVKNTSVCPLGKFNSEARRPEDCISCFCFGVATECASANLFTYQIPLPDNRYKLIPVEMSPDIRIYPEINFTDIYLLENDGVHIQGYHNEINKHDIIYFGLSEYFTGNQLKSYGGYLHYDIKYTGNGINNDFPAVIITGNGLTLSHDSIHITPNHRSRQDIQFIYGEWFKHDHQGKTYASREDIMMVLANIEHILIKAQYENLPHINVSIANVTLDSARDVGIDLAPLVEECRCPSGYTGLSCENCAPGFIRRKTGRWLGQCYKETPIEVCPRGFYGNPSAGIPCEPCPCPLPSNQLNRSCTLDSDGVSPKCHCPPGYEGTRCERCAHGYQGNPLRGEECRSYDQCDHSGSLSTEVNAHTRRCLCKEHVTGPNCNQCKQNTFSLSSANQFGCIACFCMGITNTCTSSNWYRSEIRVSFTNSIREFSLTGSNDQNSDPITTGINLNPENREIVFTDFPDRGAGDVYYWQLPTVFLGNQITAYGGNLKYTIRYVPSPGGLTSRNSAPFVELISSNDITLLYYSREFPEPNIAKTYTVPLLEQYWQRSDGTTADREHLLMALADVEAIKIKATYTTHTNEAALQFVSMDSAEEFNTGRQHAIEVEKCSCPPGYQGLSCENCAVGYMRTIEGLYLGICEPCKCNGHSQQCDPETGICENCADHTTGENCEICESGYEGNATRGTPYDCQVKNGSHIPCHCNPLGSKSNSCNNGQCDCKSNVEGTECNRCRYSTFGLSQKHPDGCTECFCSGVTHQCHESSLYIQQIPMFIYDNQHGLTLTDSSRREIINDNFELNIPVNEIGYRFSPEDRRKRLFWSLPNAFTGNKVKSYGGNLALSQRIMAQPNAVCHKDQDVIISGNGITLYWTNPEDVTPRSTLVYSVPLIETEWRHLSSIGLRVASRSDLMMVLVNIDAILVRASYCDEMIATYISDISLDTAVDTPTINPRASQVEVCKCPAGYIGTSCEACAPGYYRNVTDRSVNILGSCTRCPCNGNEESCELYRSGHVKCNCHPQFSGRFCQDTADFTESPTMVPSTTSQSSPIAIKIREPKIQIVKIGDSVRYHCSARSQNNEPITMRWEKEDGYLPAGRGIDDSFGLLFIREVKVSDSGNYICHVTDGVHVRREKVTLHVGDSVGEPVIDIHPPLLKVFEGDTAEFNCKTTEPYPLSIEWIRTDGRMNPNATYSGETLRIPSVTSNDAAEYKCIVRTRKGSSEKSAQLHVKELNYDPAKQLDISLSIAPAKWSGFSGDTVKLVCTASKPVQKINWSRTDRLMLPTTATQYNGVLTILNPSVNDAGWYICTITSHDGSEKSTTTSVAINPRHEMPVVSIDPQRQKVPQGSTATIRCNVDGNESNIKWIKSREPNLGPNVEVMGNTIVIKNAQISNRGVYTCRLNHSEAGHYEASAILEIEPREMPQIQIHPKESQTVLEGNTADFHCRAIAGIPTPEIKWSRQDGRPLGRNSQVISGGMLRINNITIADAGTYVCIAENSIGTTSATANLEIQSYPTINITPQNGIVRLKLGDKLHLMCNAAGYPQPVVSWSKDYDDQPLVIDPYKTGMVGPSATIDINSVSKEDEGTYKCRASNSAGVVEDYVQIRIEDDGNSVDYPEICRGDTPCYNPPPDTENKNNGPLDDRVENVPSGGKAVIRCHLWPLQEDKRLYIDWKREDGRPMPPKSTISDGTLYLNDLRLEDSGDYTCFGLDAHGRQVFSAKTRLYVLDYPRVELRPIKQTVRPGESPSIHCIATGEKPLNVEWEAVGRPLPASITQSNGVLQFYGITFSDAGKYVCKAWNDLGAAESVAEVSVDASATPIVKVRASKNPVNVRDSVELQCVTSGIVNPRYVWSRPYEISLPWNVRETGNILRIENVNTSNQGVYRCAIDFNGRIIEDDITLHVQDNDGYIDPYGSNQDPYGPPDEIKYIHLGSNAEISCRDNLQPPVRYQWTKANGSLPAGHSIREDELVLTDVSEEAAGIYKCRASNHQDVVETYTTVVVSGVLPYFSQAPLSFIELPPLSDAYLRFKIEISFRPEIPNGILLYTSENINGDGDFLSLSLEHGHPVFKFDLGSGTTIIQGDQNLTIGNWHTIVIRRERKEGIMIVNDAYQYTATSTGKKDGLDVHDLLYVGGIPENVFPNLNVGATGGFVGCINKLVIGDKLINLMNSTLHRQSITNCEICEEFGSLCENGVCQESTAKNGYECICNIGYSGNYCQNTKEVCRPGICGDGMCTEVDDGYACDCPIGKTGPNCEFSQMVRTPKLSHPRSYLAYSTPKSLRRPG